MYLGAEQRLFLINRKKIKKFIVFGRRRPKKEVCSPRGGRRGDKLYKDINTKSNFIPVKPFYGDTKEIVKRKIYLQGGGLNFNSVFFLLSCTFSKGHRKALRSHWSNCHVFLSNIQ